MGQDLAVYNINETGMYITVHRITPVCRMGGGVNVWRTLGSCDKSGKGDGNPTGSTGSPAYQRAASYTPGERERER